MDECFSISDAKPVLFLYGVSPEVKCVVVVVLAPTHSSLLGEEWEPAGGFGEGQTSSPSARGSSWPAPQSCRRSGLRRGSRRRSAEPQPARVLRRPSRSLLQGPRRRCWSPAALSPAPGRFCCNLLRPCLSRLFSEGLSHYPAAEAGGKGSQLRCAPTAPAPSHGPMGSVTALSEPRILREALELFVLPVCKQEIPKEGHVRVEGILQLYGY